MPKTIAGMLTVSVLVLTACANAPERTADSGSPARACFQPVQVSGFNDAPGDNRIYVHTGPNETFLFETFGSCPDLDFAQDIGFDFTPTGSICSGLDVTLVVPSTIGPRRCPVRMIRKLSQAERDAR